MRKIIVRIINFFGYKEHARTKIDIPSFLIDSRDLIVAQLNITASYSFSHK
ncbi:hypothetical protein QUF82_05780 [Thiotrichales bacterium HSG14]|nr:hypothetical protein [Thiotrichales bacterium HSG14]